MANRGLGVCVSSGSLVLHHGISLATRLYAYSDPAACLTARSYSRRARSRRGICELESTDRKYKLVRTQGWKLCVGTSGESSSVTL